MAQDKVRVDLLFLAALEKVTAAERSTYLESACAGDRDLRARVERLLAAQDKVSSFLESPAPGLSTQTPRLDVPSATEQSGSVIGPYRLLEEIGEGGMGTVYMAQQTEPVLRQVALKLIKPGMDTRQVVARFEQERQALALMDHPNIARVLDGGTTQSGRPYFVMELVRGEPLTKYCDEQRLTPRDRLALFIPVCQAIQHAHQKGIIHRDIKPSNVLVALYDGKPVPKVIDFGVAKATGQPLTEQTLVTGFGAVVGTLEYMSPEQAEINQLDVDTRSDIYSLGVLLYELLTGTTPLEHKRLKEAALLELLRLIREEEPPRPSTRLSTAEALPSIAASRGLEPRKLSGLVRGDLDWIVMKALEKDRNRRYETANALAMDAQRYLSDEAVQACPPSVGYRFRKFIRRNKTALAITAVLALAFSLVAGTLGWSVRDRSAREQAVARDQAAREAALDDQVTQTLDEAEAVLALGRGAEAAAAVGRSEKLLSVASRHEFPPRLLELQKDLSIAQRLEDIYSRPKKEDFFTGRELDDAYAKAFVDAGIDVATLPMVEAAERIKARTIWRELCRGLDIWAGMRRRSGNQVTPDWKRLLEIAEIADPDPWRNRLRQAQKHGDSKALVALAASADVARMRPETLHIMGDALYESGAKEQALTLLSQAQLHYPDDWWISNLLGWCCLTAEPPRYDEAIRYYTAAQALRPQNPYTLDGVGRGLLGKKASAEALAVYARSIKLKPELSTTWCWAGVAHYEMGRQDEAIAAYKEAIRLEPDFAEPHNNLGVSYRETGRLDEAIAACKEAIRLEPGYALAHNNLGIALRRKGLLEEASVAYREAIRSQPDYARAHFHLGVVLSEMGRRDEAVAAYKEAIHLEPDFAEPHNNLGVSLRELGRLDEAIDAGKEAIRLEPGYALAHNNLGIALRRKGRVAEACAAYREAIRCKPGYALAHLNLGNALSEMGRHDEAVTAYKEAIRLKPDFAKARNNLGVSLRELGRLDEAIDACKEAIRLEPGYALAQNNLGIALRKKGRLEEASAAYREAIRCQPEYAVAHLHLGVALSERGLLEEASAEFGEATRLRPEDVQLQLAMGDTYARHGQWERAAANFAKAFDLRSPQSAMPWFEHACLRLELRDIDGYRQLCSRMRERFCRSKSPCDIAVLTHACALAANVPGTAERVRELAEQCLAPASSSSELHPAWTIHVLGLASYRAGQYDKAVAHLKKSLKDHPNWEHSVLNWLVLAMAEQRLGHSAETKEYFGTAKDWLAQKTRSMDKTSHRFAPPGWKWRDWLTVQLFRREAESLIRGEK
jgi:tetratricopeptide (TPR) repeat protein